VTNTGTKKGSIMK